MNIFDIITREKFTELQTKAGNREKFKYIKELKVPDGTITVTIDGFFVREDIARGIWDGEKFVCGCNINYHRTNHIGGIATPLSREEFLKYSFEDFVNNLERHEHCFPDDYTKFKNVSEQISFF